MFNDLSENERQQIKSVANRLLTGNILVRSIEPDLYMAARRHKAHLEYFFAQLEWTYVLDERHECAFVSSPEASHRRSLSRDESIWLLILRLLYQEKRAELSLSNSPSATLHEIRAKYDTFRIPFISKTRLQELVRLCNQYRLIQLIDGDIRTDDCRLSLLHSFNYAIPTESIEILHQKIARYGEGGEDHEVDEAAEIN